MPGPNKDDFARSGELFTALLDAVSYPLKRYCRWLAYGHAALAEDFFQEAWTACLGSQAKWETIAAGLVLDPDGRLTGIGIQGALIRLKYAALAACARHRRKKATQVEQFESDLGGHLDLAGPSYEGLERRQWVKGNFDRLASKVGQQLLWRRYGENATFKAIGDELRVGITRVRRELSRHEKRFEYLLNIDLGVEPMPVIANLRAWMAQVSDKWTTEKAARELPFAMPHIEACFGDLGMECREAGEVFIGAFAGVRPEADKLAGLSDLIYDFFLTLHGVRPIGKPFGGHFWDRDKLLIHSIHAAWQSPQGLAGSGVIYAEDGRPYQLICCRGRIEGEVYITPFLIRQVIQA